MRFLLFAYHSVYRAPQQGGWKDLHSRHGDLATARTAAEWLLYDFLQGRKVAKPFDTFQIVDMETSQCWEGTVSSGPDCLLVGDLSSDILIEWKDLKVSEDDKQSNVTEIIYG